jgi:hypothetical protein
VRRVLAFALLLALVAAAAAGAERGDPQERINAADQARAKSMLLRKSDLVPGFRTLPRGQGSFYCAALDESDLTITGDAESPLFQLGRTALWLNSTAAVYESVSDADASWRRGTSAAGFECLRRQVRSDLGVPRAARLSLQRLAFPRLAPKTVAFRARIVDGGVRVYLDLIALQQSRAQVAFAILSSPVAPQRGDELEFARTLAERMKTAMRRP